MGIRILHTSDWHLGRRFGEFSLMGDQARFVDWLVDVARAEGVHVVAVAGDIYDRSWPPEEAERLWWSAAERLADEGRVVLAIGGNHDSAERLGAVGGLTEARGVYVRSGFGAAGGVDVVSTSAGPLAVTMVPYLEPTLAPAGFCEPEVAAVSGSDDGGDEGGDDGADAGRADTGAAGVRARRRPTHEAVIARALGRARADLPPGLPSLVLSHAFVAQALRSDSERDIAVGDAALVAADVYSDFDYVALGHLHRPQVVRAEGCIRYAGSPLAYSFSESGPKQVVVAELGPRDGGWSVDARPIDVGVGRRAVTVTGTVDDLLAGEPNTSDWVRAELTDTLRPSEPMSRLRPRFPHLAEIDWVGDGSTPRQGRTVTDVTRRGPLELAGDFWAERMHEPFPDDLAAILAGAFVEVEGDERGVA